MQVGSTNAACSLMRKARLRGLLAVEKSDASERVARRSRNRDTQIAQCRKAVGHQALSTGLIDRRNCAIGNDDAQAVTPGSNRSHESSRTAADDEDVNRIVGMAGHNSRTSLHRLAPNCFTLKVFAFRRQCATTLA
jgi:hypothetical protein